MKSLIEKLADWLDDKWMPLGLAGCWKCSEPDCSFNKKPSAKLLALLWRFAR